MGLRKFKPTTPGTRHAVLPDFAEVTRSRPEKRLLEPLRSSGGRNNHGHTTARFRGGGHKRMYRRIDFHRNKDGVPGKVVSIEYDPNRSARIALVQYADGEKRYILAPRGLTVGQRIENGPGSEPAVGNAMPLASIPVGLAVHNVEMVPGRGGQLAKSAGSQITLAGREGKHAILILPSGEMRRVPVQCRATIGQVGNIEHNLVKLGKAGRSRWHGRRPHNRGVAMNPVAHPMGGGEGRSGGGRHPCSPTGKLAKGGKTRNPRKTAQRFVIRRRSKKKK